MSNVNIRAAGNRSKFYPYDHAEIDRMIETWEGKIDFRHYPESLMSGKLRIAIVPHAGYIYSGFTAYKAYKLLQNSQFKRIIVVGPSHHIFINGFSIAENDFFETPYGNLEIDLEYVEEIQANFNVDFQGKAHYVEHSTETQMPFIKRLFPKIKIAEIIYGRTNADSLFNLFNYILGDIDNCLIISTDLSHFYSQENANLIDNNCITAFKERNLKLLMDSCEACGKEGLIAVLKYIIQNDLEVLITDYRTSAGVTGDFKRVVGYMSAVI